MLLPLPTFTLLPFLLLTALPFTNAQGATGYAFCASPNLRGACQYVASTMAGFNACNAIPERSSLQVWEGTSCKVSRSENCECDKSGDDSEECEVVQGARTLEDLSKYKINGRGEEGKARSFSCEVILD